MIAGALFLAAAQLALLLGASALTRRLRTGETAVDWLLLALARGVLAVAVLLAAGWTGLLTRPALGLAALAALAVLFAAGAHRTLPRIPRLRGPTALLAAAVVLRLLLQAWFLAPHDPDATGYHLPKVAEWIRAGGFTRYMGEDPLVTLPASFELFETLWCVFLRHDALIELAGAEFLLLGALAVAGLGRRMGLSPDAAACAGALYALMPGPAVQAVSCLNDGPVASLLLAALLLAEARAPLWALAMPVGLGLGMKATFGYALPGVLLLWLGRDRRPLWRAGAPGTSIPLAALALLGGASWYFRNVFWHGNPFHPIGSPEVTANYGVIQVGLRPGSLVENASSYLGRFVPSTEPMTGLLEFNAGWGPLGLAAVPALIAALRARMLPARWVAALATAAACVFLAVTPDPWVSRFVVFLCAPLCLAAAWAAGRSRAAWAVVALAALAQVILFTVPGHLKHEQTAAMVGRGVAARAFPTAAFGPPPEADRLGLWSNWRHPQYLLYGPDFRRGVVPLRTSRPGDLPDLMRSAEVRWVCVQQLSGWMYGQLDRLVERGVLRRGPPGFYGLP